MTTKHTILSQKKDRFLSAPKFAVVGASTDPSKNGSKALKWLVGHHKDVVPINLKASEIQGIKCLKTLSELPDPTHTAVSIVVHPEVTLEILREAKALNIFALWLQPGAEDEAVVKFIQADTQLEERCIYNTHALHEHGPTPSRTRSKPEPLSTSTNLPPMQAAASSVVENIAAPPADDDQLPPCLWADPTTVQDTLVQVSTIAPATLEQKKTLFLSAPKFAVVGASMNDSKNGSKALKWLVEQHKDVVPVNLKATEIQGIKCIKSLSELPDPTHTSVSIVVPPKVTLSILQQAKSLGVFALWLQPGAEDDTVVEFIEADAQLRDRCVYRAHALHTSSGGPKILNAAILHTDTLPTCLFASPIVSTEPSLPSAPLGASNVVAGTKHDMLSPPSTPPATKSLKLSPESKDSSPQSGASMTDLGEEIPGLA